jgi:CubicO group peptidase (beta-lactamase class C family)
MLAMTSGLSFNEDYGDVTDVTRMLYLEPDMTAFAASQPAVAAPGAQFNYSTGTAVMLSKIWMQAEGGGSGALNFPRDRLFAPLGMTTAIFEADEAGTLVGGSYVYASARDWARLGQFVLQDGQWNGKQLLAPELVAMMRTSNGLPGGYSQFQTWVKGPHESEDGQDYGLPADTFWFEGHDGQTVAVVPSLKLVVVRMGLTPWKLDFRPEYLLKAVVDALGSGG